MKMFRIAMLLTCAASLFFACGCGKKDDGKLKVAISIPSADHGWTGGVVWWAEQGKGEMEARDPNLKINISTAKDSAEQVSKSETMLVQGIIDVCFEEDGELVVLDYKTDKIWSEQKLLDKYQSQLEYYARALEQITGKKVREKIIYSFTMQKEFAWK